MQGVGKGSSGMTSGGYLVGRSAGGSGFNRGSMAWLHPVAEYSERGMAAFVHVCVDVYEGGWKAAQSLTFVTARYTSPIFGFFFFLNPDHVV